jgi:hypothetical protein
MASAAFLKELRRKHGLGEFSGLRQRATRTRASKRRRSRRRVHRTANLPGMRPLGASPAGRGETASAGKGRGEPPFYSSW